MDYAIGLTVVILKVAVGLGFVIFVHELGHFAVAKLCGVKCEKFYLGFDIAGLKLCKFRWGETEYGIGILPLGGYVKMLGQEDNPAKLREEIERAKQKEGSGFRVQGSDVAATEIPQSSIPNPQSPIPNPPLYDPRSFLAKSVPKRMAIISAGVVMNVIFAFLMAVAAFGIGVKQMPCMVGDVWPGEPAWQADLRTSDEILEIAGKKMTRFRDLQTAISLGDIDPDKGVALLVRRPGVKEPFSVTVKPDRSRGAFLIGITNPKTTRLTEDRKTWLVQERRWGLPGSAADRAEPAFRNGDQIVRIDDAPIDDYGQIDVELARKADRKVTVVVQRTVEDARGRPTTRRVTVPLAPNPMRDLGLVMKMGKVTAVQNGSPAEAAGIMPGDLIGSPAGDPMTLPDRLCRRAGETIEITIQREESKTPIVVLVRLRQPIGFYPPRDFNGPVAVSALGVAYQVLNRVDSVVEGSPAAKAGLRPGDLIVRAKLIPPDKEVLRKLNFAQSEIHVPFSETQRNWPLLIDVLQNLLPGTTVQLTFSRQDQEQTVLLAPVETADWFNPQRGFLFEPMTSEHKAGSVGEAFALGGRETLDDLTIVFRTVKKLSTNEVSMRLLGGPVSIFRLATRAADAGTAKFLLFLTFLSANLAVLNFLPIPVLDGGLFVLLAYEGLRGKPADERVQAALSYLGLILIVALMVWVFGLDFGLISRR